LISVYLRRIYDRQVGTSNWNWVKTNDNIRNTKLTHFTIWWMEFFNVCVVISHLFLIKKEVTAPPSAEVWTITSSFLGRLLILSNNLHCCTMCKIGHDIIYQFTITELNIQIPSRFLLYVKFFIIWWIADRSATARS
jgi:hypothetical protein